MPPCLAEAIWFKSGHHSSDLLGELPVLVCLSFRGGNISDGFEQAMVVNQDTHSSVVNSTASLVFNGAWRWMSSALYRPLMVSVTAL